jgi:hypothetical protein
VSSLPSRLWTLRNPLQDIDIHNAIKLPEGNKAIHLALSQPNPDVEFVQALIARGANLEDTNLRGESGIDFLIATKDYGKFEFLLTHFIQKIPTYQITEIFSHLEKAGRYDLCAPLLNLLAKFTKDYILVEYCLEKVASHLPMEAIQYSVEVILKLKPDNLSSLKYIAQSSGNNNSKKQIMSKILMEVMNKIPEPTTLLHFTQQLEQEIQKPENNLDFFRQRTSASLTGHIWHATPACGTWVRLMEAVKQKMMVMPKISVHADENKKVIAFLKEPTRQRFTLFSFNPYPEKLAERYERALLLT